MSQGADPTSWFEELYARADAGEAEVPWHKGAPNPRLVDWGPPDGAGKRALVVGSGLGDDAEYVAARGYDTTAFDVSPTAIAMSERRFPDSPVGYVVANLLDPPAEWRHAFDIVVENITVQAMPPEYHAEASAGIAEFVAPGGTLLVLSAAREEDDAVTDGPPWPLTRAEIDAFVIGSGLEVVKIEELFDATVSPFAHRWRAEFRRPAAA